MKGVAHRDSQRLKALGAEDANRLLNRLAGTANHGLFVAVEVRRHHVAVNLVQGRMDNIERRHHSGHPARIVHAHLGHLGATGSGGLQRLGKGHNPGGDERAILTQRVAHHHIGPHPVLAQQRQNRHIQREHRGLRDRRLHQRALGLLLRRRVAAVHK